MNGDVILRLVKVMHRDDPQVVKRRGERVTRYRIGRLVVLDEKGHELASGPYCYQPDKEAKS